MNEIKEQFKQWLIRQGLAEKTKSGRPGTVYEYIKRIDRLSLQLYGKENWEGILKDIYVVYILHVTLASKKYKGAKPQKVYDYILGYGKITPVKDTGRTIISEKVLLKYIDQYLKWLESNPQKIRAIKTAINKLYEFYSNDEDLFDKINPVKAKQTEGQKIKLSSTFAPDFFSAISLAKSAMNDEFIFAIILRCEADGIHSRRVEPRRDGLGIKQKKLCSKDAAASLNCSERTVKRIAARRKNLLGKDGYSVVSIHRFLKKHHHPSKTATPSTRKINKYDWITGSEAAAILGCPLTTFIRKYRDTGLVSYTDYTPRQVRYYKPDVLALKNNH